MLDNTSEILEKDHDKVLTATENLWKQCQDAWSSAQKITLPEDYQDISHLIIMGMGGSHLGGEIIKSVYDKTLSIPLIIKSDYENPGYITEKSLVIATSYSGNTEEALSFAQQAYERKAKIICISSGGKLAEFAQERNLPVYLFDDKENNPSSIPRYGSGYLFVSQMIFLQMINAISLKSKEIEAVILELQTHHKKYGINIKEANNPAKELAQLLYQKATMIVASEHLTGSAYIFKNQLNESAKSMSNLFEIPELNHHLLEGLANPKSLKDSSVFISMQSDLYHSKNLKRHHITKEIVENMGFKVFSWIPSAKDRLTQAFEAVSFTSYVAFYLAILNKVDPGPNPWVDSLKEKLKQ